MEKKKFKKKYTVNYIIQISNSNQSEWPTITIVKYHGETECIG